MKTSKLLFLGMLIVALAVPAMAVTFTGDVDADFTGPDILTFPDPGGQEVFVPGHPGPPTPPVSSGWDIKDIRLAYNPSTDTLYVGINSYETVGDVDTNGQDCTATYGGGADIANLGGSEVVSVYFDLDQVPPYDVIVGVQLGLDISGFSVNLYAGNQLVYGAPIAGALGTVYYNPACGGDTDSDPDLEFEILNFSTLPGQAGNLLGSFDIGAFMGSLSDGNIGEDDLVGTVSSDARISIAASGTNPVDTPHDFTVTVEQNDGTGWTAASGVSVTGVISSGPGSITSPNPDNTDGSGEMTVTVYSASTGIATVNASGTVTVNAFPIDVATDGYGAETVDNQKTWVDARISIGTSGTNPIDTPHDFTVTVEQDDGTGWADAVGVTVTPSHSGAGSITSSVPYITDGLGQVTITVNSATAGTATVHASGTVTVGGVPIDVATDGYGAFNVSNEKTWIGNPDIHIEKATNGDDADFAPGPILIAGDPVTWTYVVTNTGEVPLTNVEVTDDNGTPGDTSDDFNPTPVDVSPADGFNDGDLNKDDVLDLTEIWLYEATGTALPGQYENWACVDGYYELEKVSDCDPSHYAAVVCYDETAFGYNGAHSTCFLDLLPRSKYKFKNWGWTNGPLAEGQYTFDIYAAAGQCILDNGILVGTLTVTYSGGAVSYDAVTVEPYEIVEEHFYAGSTKTPEVTKGSRLIPTVAPGQYYIENPLVGDIYIIYHAVIEWCDIPELVD